MTFILSWADVTWRMLVDSALLLFVGFFLAGVLRALITPSVLSTVFGKRPLAQVLRASLVGIPLPLCSCSVLPVAVQLRKAGLSRPGTASFLVSTPETGADSIALSYKLLGPIFALVRPLAALFVALAAGIVTRLTVRPETTAGQPLTMAAPSEKESVGWLRRLADGQIYVIKDILPELAYYLLWGYLLAGLAAAVIPADLVRGGVAGWIQYLGVIAVGLPVYVCATSSTPLAAVLLGIGISPGAVLVFLLVGPATNLTSLVVIKQILGLKTTMVLTASVVVFAVVTGVIFDLTLADAVRLPFQSPASGGAGGEEAAGYDIISAIALMGIMLYYTFRHYYRKLRKRISATT